MNKYSTPKLYRGKAILSIPKGSSKLKELAKNKWYVNYTFNGEQIRVTGGINRIKDETEKEYEAQVILYNKKAPANSAGAFLLSNIFLFVFNCNR